MSNRPKGLSRREVLKLGATATVSAGLMGAPFGLAAQDQQAAQAGSNTWPFELPELPYAENALEPYIDARTMGIHHGKHHAGYTAKLNAALEGSDLIDMSIEDILADIDSVSEDIRTAVRNNGGGYANHRLFWQIMSPAGGGEPSGALAEAIGSAFGGFGEFQTAFAAAAGGVFGSGWAWLVADGGALSISTTPNQDTPLMQGRNTNPRHRRLGACVLPPLSESARGLCRRLLQHHQLGAGRRALRGCLTPPPAPLR